MKSHIMMLQISLYLILGMQTNGDPLLKFKFEMEYEKSVML